MPRISAKLELALRNTGTNKAICLNGLEEIVGVILIYAQCVGLEKFLSWLAKFCS